MDTTTLIITLATTIMVIVGLPLAFVLIRRQRTRQLQKAFGPEYDRMSHEMGDLRQAEKELEERRKRVESLQLRTLTTDESQRFQRDWIQTQTEFVDNPSRAVEKAHHLIVEVLLVRGYPNSNYEDRIADISVGYPELVSNYRNARAIRKHDQQNGATTDELRLSFTQYRSLFEELIQPEENGS